MSRNIKTSDTDLNYRYKMPYVQLKVETNKTLILNIKDIAKSLHVLDLWIIKYISFKSGSISQHNSINGFFTIVQINTYIDDFINHYVLCIKCKLPETYLLVENNQLVSVCNSCGTRNKIKNHKLNNLIIKSISDKLYKPVILTPKNVISNSNSSHTLTGWSIDTSKNAVDERHHEHSATFSHIDNLMNFDVNSISISLNLLKDDKNILSKILNDTKVNLNIPFDILDEDIDNL